MPRTTRIGHNRVRHDLGRVDCTAAGRLRAVKTSIDQVLIEEGSSRVSPVTWHNEHRNDCYDGVLHSTRHDRYYDACYIDEISPVWAGLCRGVGLAFPAWQKQPQRSPNWLRSAACVAEARNADPVSRTELGRDNLPSCHNPTSTRRAHFVTFLEQRRVRGLVLSFPLSLAFRCSLFACPVGEPFDGVDVKFEMLCGLGPGVFFVVVVSADSLAPLGLFSAPFLARLRDEFADGALADAEFLGGLLCRLWALLGSDRTHSNQ